MTPPSSFDRTGLQTVPAEAAPSARGAALAVEILSGDLPLGHAVSKVAAHLGADERVDVVVAALTALPPEDPAEWMNLGERAWLREWVKPGSPCSIVPPPGAGPESALTMPWMSQHARHDVAVVPDTDQLPPSAAQDRRELASCHVRAVVASSQLSEGTMYGSISVASQQPGDWPEPYVVDVRLLSAALTSRMAAEKATRSLADAIALGDQARAAQQQFFATIGHELRTPIAAILGFAEVLGDDARDQGPDAGPFAKTVAHDSGVIIRASEQLLAIVEDLLSTGRTLGNEEPREDHDISAAVADVIHWHRTPAVAGSVSVTSLVEPGVVAHARASGLRQVLTNLIGNAIIHNAPGGSVEISTQRSFGESREPRVRILVRDTGPGLAPGDLSRVFDPFVRFADAQVKGTGLGLPMARAVAERDGGVVGAESTLGKGSVFWVDFPATEG